MKKLVFILAISLFSAEIIIAQDTKSTPGNEFSLFIGPSITNIKNDNISNDKYASSKGANWLNAGFGFCKYFNKNFGMLLGLEYSMYKNEASYKGAYRSEEKSVDRDGYLYYAVSEADYKVTRTVHCGEVPVGLRLQVPINDKSQFFVDLGLRLNFIASAKVSQKGTLNRKGAYPSSSYDNVFLYIEDDTYYGFTNNTYNMVTDIPVSRVNLGYFIGGGVKAKITDNKYLIVNPSYMNGISDLVKKDGTSDYVDIFGEKTPHKKFTLSQFALRIGIVFEL